MEALLGKTLDELQTLALELGLPRFTGRQIADWLYVKRVRSLDEMTNLSLKAREVLAQRYTIGRHAASKKVQSVDGTIKYLFPVTISSSDGSTRSEYVESVYIPEEDRATLCVSTQAGCKMGCRFCMTGTLGFHGQLAVSDILNQIFEVDATVPQHLTNIVYMGEGEPMDNLDNVLRSLSVMTATWACAWSPKRITVSSVGLLPQLKRYLDECECHLAISLHNPFAIERQEFMPVEKMCHLTDVIALIKRYDFTHQRRVSFEYICFGGVNDTIKHANELLRLLKGIDCRINLIRFHEGVDRQFPASNASQMEWLRDYLTERGITTTIRRSRGEDILAACGMLVNASIGNAPE